MKILALIFFILASFKALAGYKCDIKLSSSSDLEKLLSQKTVFASESDLSSMIIQDFFQDKDLHLNVMMDGWKGEEQASFFVTRGNKKISEKSSLIGNQKETIWFDNFKLDIQCDLKA